MNKDNDNNKDFVVRFESGVAAHFSSSDKRKIQKQLSEGPLQSKSASASNISYYSRSFLADSISALTASFFVAIPVATIDRAIVQSVAGTVPLEKGLLIGFKEVFMNPIKTITRKSYFMVLGVYTATYLTANLFESTIQRVEDIEYVSSKKQTNFKAEIGMNEAETEKLIKALQIAKFIGVTAVNMTAAVSKDRAFARRFGTVAPSKLPMISWGCWITRDLLTIGAAFSLPKPLSKYLSTSKGENKEPIMSEKWANIAAQLLPVMMVQVFSTPLHLTANDYYNFKKGEPRVFDENGKLKSGQKTTKERLDLLIREGPKSFLARLCRIAPAFGFGGIGNKNLRESDSYE